MNLQSSFINNPPCTFTSPALSPALIFFYQIRSRVLISSRSVTLAKIHVAVGPVVLRVCKYVVLMHWGCLLIEGTHAEYIPLCTGLCILCLARWLSSALELQVDSVVNLECIIR